MAFPPTNLTPPSLSDYQLSYNGFLLGTMTPLGWLKVTGLIDLPDVRQGDENQPRSNGQFIGLDLYGARDITISIYVNSTTQPLQATLNALASATGVGYTTEQPLWFQLPTYPVLCVMCRPRKRATVIDQDYQIGVAYPSAQFHTTDPNIYEASQTASVGL